MRQWTIKLGGAGSYALIANERWIGYLQVDVGLQLAVHFWF